MLLIFGIPITLTNSLETMFASICRGVIAKQHAVIPFLSLSCVARSFSAVTLNRIALLIISCSLYFIDNLGAKKRKTRVGRGNAAGQGTTAGRGEHGQNSRSGPISFVLLIIILSCPN